jgi:predicted ATPase
MDLVDSIVDYLAGRRVLIILDNCEHVIDSARSLADRLIEADHVHVLATSREALAVDGEQQLIVSPLATDTAGVELFVDRAKQRDARFELTADNRAAVLEVAERLDGIPLAIELAAARIRVFTPFELAERLRENFKVLEAAGQTERQGTLNNTVRWSYELLSTPEAALFVRLSVFAGGFSLGAVEEICADDALVHVDAIPELMLALVDKSMIESQELSAHQRFRMLETLRVFAEGQLAQTGGYEAVRAKHADHFSQLALFQNERLFSPAEPDAWRVLDSEWSNLRTALDHYENGSDLDRASELVIALVWYATISMRFELFSWAEELLAAPGVETHRQFTDLCGAAALGSYFTVDGHVTDRAEIGLAADASDREGFCRCALAAVFLNNVHTPEASGALTSAWIDSQPQTTSGRLWAHSFRVFHLVQSGPSAEAVEQAAIVTRLAEESGSPTAKALAAWANGLVVSFDDLDRAVRTWSEGTDFSRSLPGDHLIDQLLVGLILHVTARRGELSRTLSWCQNALRSTLVQHYHAGTSHLFGVTAIALSRAGDAQTGARLIGSMIEHGHLPRRNARHELNAALGDDMNDLMASGSLLSVTQAAHVAIEALEAALERVNSDES